MIARLLLASVGLAMEAAEQALASANQVSLFGGDDSDLIAPPEYVKTSPWTEKQKLAEEKVALGLYLSGHMFNAYAKEARHFARQRLADLVPGARTEMDCWDHHWLASANDAARPDHDRDARR